MNFRAVPINMVVLSKQSLPWLANTMKKKLFPFMNSLVRCEKQKESTDTSHIATEHSRKPYNELLLKAFCVVPCLLIQHPLAKSFTPGSEAILPALNWAMKNIKFSGMCSNASSFHVRHPLLQEPVRRAWFSTQCFCHQVCNTNPNNPLPLTDGQRTKSP